MVREYHTSNLHVTHKCRNHVICKTDVGHLPFENELHLLNRSDCKTIAEYFGMVEAGNDRVLFDFGMPGILTLQVIVRHRMAL